jgi:hypothetical protein
MDCDQLRQQGLEAIVLQLQQGLAFRPVAGPSPGSDRRRRLRNSESNHQPTSDVIAS